MSFKYAAWITYRGTLFCGWQKQSALKSGPKPSIQELIENALLEITEEPKISVVGSGRTDAGVHALGQVAHFRLTRKEWKPDILVRALNTKLPVDIRIQAVSAVPLDFHAQRSALSKQYSYYFQQGPGALPHAEPYSWWIRKPLNTLAMQEALDALKGTYDFKVFQASGAELKNTVRTIDTAEIEIVKLGFPGGGLSGADPFFWVRVKIKGTGFLKQMVRGIAGTLLEIGENRRPASDMAKLLVSQDRSKVGPTAPARALWLEQVWYPGLKWH